MCESGAPLLLNSTSGTLWACCTPYSVEHSKLNYCIAALRPPELNILYSITPVFPDCCLPAQNYKQLDTTLSQNKDTATASTSQQRPMHPVHNPETDMQLAACSCNYIHHIGCITRQDSNFQRHADKVLSYSSTYGPTLALTKPHNLC
jgi:hypothetical protein